MGIKEGNWMKVADQKRLKSKSTGVNPVALSGTSGPIRPVPSVLDALDEKSWQQLVIGFAETHGWRVAHCRKVLIKNGKKTHWETTMPKGWFDLVLVRGSVLFVELKVEPNKAEPEQIEWANLMRKAGQRVRLWYPRDWQEVQDTLR